MSLEPAAALREAFDRREVPGVVSAYLFGSYHLGREHRESDVDVGVLFDRKVYATAPDRFEARLALFASLATALRSNAIDLTDLAEAPPHLARRVMLEGLRVYVADPEADHAARRWALLRAADLEPFLRRTRRIKLDALAR